LTICEKAMQVRILPSSYKKTKGIKKLEVAELAYAGVDRCQYGRV